MKRLVRGLAVALAAAVAVPQPAFAHGGTDQAGYSNYRAVITAVEPSLADVDIEMVDVAGGIEVTYRGPDHLVVLGYNDEPYLRIGPEGVFANLNSSATYVNDRRDADVPVPDRVRTDSVPDWYRISSGRSVLWHDHRLHWMGSVPPDAVQADPDSSHVVFPRWSLLMFVGDTPIEVSGQLLWVAPPSRTRWLLAAGLVFLAVVLALQMRAGWRASLMASLVAGVGANLVVATGRALVADSGALSRAAMFGPALAIAIVAGLVGSRLRAGARRIPPWSALAGVAMVGHGIAYLQMLRYAELHSDVDATINRLAVVVELGAGAALVAAVLVDRFAPAAVIDSVPAADG